MTEVNPRKRPKRSEDKLDGVIRRGYRKFEKLLRPLSLSVLCGVLMMPSYYLIGKEIWTPKVECHPVGFVVINQIGQLPQVEVVIVE
jgi:hypothetical protein